MAVSNYCPLGWERRVDGITRSAGPHERRSNPFATALSMDRYWGLEAIEVASGYLCGARTEGRRDACAFWVRVCILITQLRLRRIQNALPTAVEWPVMNC